ncbi:MAG: restriction endonuclease subunit S [Treponema sp.]|nr:restriction endonuclease subunit S [Treponema sp.]
MSNIPKLRFPEFKGEWEEKKLSDFMTRLTRKNSNNESSRTLTISSVDGLIDQGEFFKKQIASKDTSGYYLLKKGDFAYNKSYSVGYDYGSIKRLDRYEDGVVSTLYICMSLTSDTNSDYLTHYFDSMKWNKSVSEISAEGARNHGLLNIPTEAFFQTKHYLAPTLAEQQKIADFLSNVDSIITAETKILNTLQKKKKALMQKLFTQQLRFKSDDGKDFPAWEEKKLGECVISISSGKNKKKNSAGNFPVYGSMGIIGYSEQYVYNKDCILVARVGANAGTLHIAKGKYDVSDNTLIIELNENELLSFYYFLLVNINLNKLNYGTGQPLVTSGMLKNIDIQLPCKAEQQKIADCLSSLDLLIQTQQKVVTTWQQRKKALLQQMFI